MAVTDDAIDNIKAMLVSGELAPGDRLPREADLSERFGISRSSLREAVRALSAMRILDVRQGDGTYVTSLSPATLLEAVGFAAELYRDDSLLQLFEARRILESNAAALAARLIQPAQARELVESAAEGADTVEALVAHDIEFHHRIAEASQNAVLASLIDGIAGPSQRARIWRGLAEDEAIERTVREHRQIAEAIVAGQSELAAAAMTMHIAGVERWLRTARS